MIDTIEEYRKFLNPLVMIVNAQWVNLADLTSKERINAVEKMIHQTADNPDPKHKYFQNVIDKHPSFRLKLEERELYKNRNSISGVTVKSLS